MSDSADDIFSDNDEDDKDAAAAFRTHRIDPPGFMVRNQQIQTLQKEERRSRSKSPFQDQAQATSFFRNAAALATSTPIRSITNGNGQGDYNRYQPTPNKMIVSDRIFQEVTKYPFKLYLIAGIMIACLYSIFHLHMSVNEVHEDVTRTMTAFQTQISFELNNEFRKLEFRYFSEMEDLKSHVATLTSEVTKLMQKITIKHMDNENSAERVKETESDNHYSDMFKYVRIQPEISKIQEQFGPVSEMERMNTFRELLRKQKAGFRSQSRSTWVEIYSSIVSTFSPTSTRPAAIVLLIPPQLQYTQFPSCFARKLGNDINSAFHGHQKTGLKEMSSIGLSDVSSLTKIHEDLKNYFDVEGGRAVLIHNLEKVQTYEILMLFQAFCDSVAAYTKQATFIFTLNVPERIYEHFDWSQGNAHKIAHEVLQEAWVNVLPLDKRAVFISRIAVNKILVQEGDSCL